MDNLFMLNGTLFIVSDDPSFPPLGSIALLGESSHAVPRPSDLQLLSTAQAREVLGSFGGLSVSVIYLPCERLLISRLSIHGVTWLVTDPSPSLCPSLAARRVAHTHPQATTPSFRSGAPTAHSTRPSRPTH